MSDVDTVSVSSIGSRLKAAREAKGMALDDVAAKTRIPVRHLQHIENEQWDALPAPTYSVGFARSYANAVGLNGNEIGAELREQIGTPRAVYETPQSYYEPADPARVPPKSLALVAGAIALLLIAGYILWRSLAVGEVDEGQVVNPDAAAAPTQVQESPAATPVAPTGPVVLTATDEVWFRIYEGDTGASIREGIMRAGERFEVPATARAPQIRTGRPQALRVTVGSTEIPPLGEPEQTIDDVSLLASDLVARSRGGANQAGPQQPGSVTVAPPAQPQ